MRLRPWLFVLPLSLAPVVVRAQAAPAAAVVAPPAAQQIAAAVLALPPEFRADAKVLGYSGSSHQLVTLREGKGPFTCLADDPAQKEFHVACYHQAMEPFMARGRALRASGVKGDKVDSARFAEVRAGKLAMPKQPAAMYQLFGAARRVRRGDGDGEGAVALRRLHARCDDGVDRPLGEAGGGDAVDHVSRHAEGAHHVAAEDVDGVRHSLESER